MANWVAADTERMRKERIRRGWTTRDVASRASELGEELDYSTYARCEGGMNRPMLRTVRAIAKAFDLEVEELLLSESSGSAA